MTAADRLSSIPLDYLVGYLHPLERKYPAFVQFQTRGWFGPGSTPHGLEPYPAKTQAALADEDRVDCDQCEAILRIAEQRKARPDLGRQTRPGDACAIYGCLHEAYGAPVGIPLCRRHYAITTGVRGASPRATQVEPRSQRRAEEVAE